MPAFAVSNPGGGIAIAKDDARGCHVHRKQPRTGIVGLGKPPCYRRLPGCSRSSMTAWSVTTIQSETLRLSSAAARWIASWRLVGIRVVSRWSRGSWPLVTPEVSGNGCRTDNHIGRVFCTSFVITIDGQPTYIAGHGHGHAAHP